MIKLKQQNKNNYYIYIFILSALLIFIFLFSQNLSAYNNTSTEELFGDKRISINFKDVGLKKAIIMMADLADINLICDSSVKGELTVVFDDVLFSDAFELMLKSYDLDYTVQNRTVYVRSIKEEAQKEQLFSKKYSTDYISSEKVEEKVKNIYPELKITNLGSEGLLITASQEKIKIIDSFFKEIDLPQKQVLIKARLEEISRNEVKKLGINPDNLSKLNIISSSSGNIDDIEFTWPETFRMLEEKGASKILANPSLLTLDRQKAKLIIGDQIPVKLESVEDGQTVSNLNYIEAGIVLEFFPKIINDQQVLLEIKPSVNSIGQVISDGLPAVNSRSAETTVILDNGEMLAIGGLIKENDLETFSKLPFLSELPVLGNIFKSEDNTTMHTELIIFISTEIISSEAGEFKVESTKESYGKEMIIGLDGSSTLEEFDAKKEENENRNGKGNDDIDKDEQNKTDEIDKEMEVDETTKKNDWKIEPKIEPKNEDNNQDFTFINLTAEEIAAILNK